MIDKQKVYKLLEKYIGIVESSPNGMYPDSSGDFWAPMTEELAKNADDTIVFLNELEPKEFLYSLEVLDDITAILKSQKLLNAVRQIGKEKCINHEHLENNIKIASFYLDS